MLMLVPVLEAAGVLRRVSRNTYHVFSMATLAQFVPGRSTTSHSSPYQTNSNTSGS